MDNIEKSEIVIAAILNKALEFGLQRNKLEFDDLGLDPEFSNYFTECVEWLIHEGVIRVGQHLRTVKSSVVTNISLTSYGFAQMENTLIFGNEEMRIGQAVQKISSSGEGYARAGEFFGGIFGGFWKSLGSG